MPEPMTPADVPNELVLAALKAYCPQCSWVAGHGSWTDHENNVRTILAAALPLYAQQLGEKLGKLTIPCYRHSARPGFDNDCISCHRHAALVGARRIIEGRDRSAEAVRQLRADATPAFLITTEDALSEADAEQLRADVQITARPERLADTGWGPGDFVDYIPEDGPEVHALPELDGIYDDDERSG